MSQDPSYVDMNDYLSNFTKKFKELEKQSLSKHNNNKTGDYYHYRRPHHERLPNFLGI